MKDDLLAGIDCGATKVMVQSGVYSSKTNKISPGPCLLYTSPSPRDRQKSRMPSSA